MSKLSFDTIDWYIRKGKHVRESDNDKCKGSVSKNTFIIDDTFQEKNYYVYILENTAYHYAQYINGRYPLDCKSLIFLGRYTNKQLLKNCIDRFLKYFEIAVDHGMTDQCKIINHFSPLISVQRHVDKYYWKIVVYWKATALPWLIADFIYNLSMDLLRAARMGTGNGDYKHGGRSLLPHIAELKRDKEYKFWHIVIPAIYLSAERDLLPIGHPKDKRLQMQSNNKLLKEPHLRHERILTFARHLFRTGGEFPKVQHFSQMHLRDHGRPNFQHSPHNRDICPFTEFRKKYSFTGI